VTLGSSLRPVKAGFGPSDAFSVVEWLAKISSRHIDRAFEVLAAVLTNPRVDPWSYMTQREPIRAVLKEDLPKGTTDTIAQVYEVIGFLSSIGESSYLIRSSGTE
jgi:hypothetical protein